MTINDALTAQLQAALWECCPPAYTQRVNATPVVGDTTRQLTEDVHAFSRKDPASGGDPLRIIQAYTSFKAVLHYRLAFRLDQHFSPADPQYADLALYPQLVSGRGKLLSGAELHHRCRIGRRFVLDHGIGTVVGETAVIGDDCYLLGGVTLGACAIAGNPVGKRHPTIGHRVQIGAFARVFGDVCIGDDAIIGPQCTITRDVAPGSRVSLRTSLQVEMPPLPAGRSEHDRARESRQEGAVSHEI